MKKILFYGVGLLLLSCSKETSEQNDIVTFKEVSKEVNSLLEEQNLFLNTKKEENKDLSKSEDILSPKLKEKLPVSNLKEVNEIVMNSQNIDFRSIEKQIEVKSVSEYTKKTFKEVINLYTSSFFLQNYSIIEELKEDKYISELPLDEQRMLYELFSICDVVKGLNQNSITSKCIIDGSSVLKSFLMGALTSGVGTGVVAAIVDIGFQGISCEINNK